MICDLFGICYLGFGIFMFSSKPETLRHSLAHILAVAVRELYPGTKFGIGPAEIAKEISPIRELDNVFGSVILKSVNPTVFSAFESGRQFFL